jgi:DedD protein
MENRLKERLTGAAILVALIVLLVPEMFRGQRGDVAATASSGEGPPLRSYTIDLSNGSARTAPLQSTPPDTAAAAASESAADAAPAPAPPPPPTPAAPVASSPPTGAASPPSRAASAPPPSANAHTASSAGSGGWSVQLGLFAQHDNAERLMHSAQSKGFAASLSERDAKGLYHVQVGGPSDRAAAQTLQGRLRDQGFTAALVPPSAAGARAQPH